MRGALLRQHRFVVQFKLAEIHDHLVSKLATLGLQAESTRDGYRLFVAGGSRYHDFEFRFVAGPGYLDVELHHHAPDWESLGALVLSGMASAAFECLRGKAGSRSSPWTIPLAGGLTLVQTLPSQLRSSWLGQGLWQTLECAIASQGKGCSCSYCGGLRETGLESCPNCGAPTPEPPPLPPVRAAWRRLVSASPQRAAGPL